MWVRILSRSLASSLLQPRSVKTDAFPYSVPWSPLCLRVKPGISSVRVGLCPHVPPHGLCPLTLRASVGHHLASDGASLAPVLGFHLYILQDFPTCQLVSDAF